jgi:nitrogenase molybdenum-cofactor synthesis protein NifE
MRKREDIDILDKRKGSIHEGKGEFSISCETKSIAGSVSQRACSFCGSRVVLYPIADALHLVHGPIGCASYTADIRGSLSSGPSLHRLSFSTDMEEKDVIMGGEKKLYGALVDLIDTYKPAAAFVYVTCIVGVIGDDVHAVCKKVAAEKGIPVIPVDSEGFKGSKKSGYQAACDSLMTLVGDGDISDIPPKSINILGDFNLAGEIWMIEDYYKQMGIEVVARISGDGRIGDIQRMHGAALNIVQCSGSVTSLAKQLEDKYGQPYMRASYFGIEDMSKALYDVAEFFKDDEMMAKAKAIVASEVKRIMPILAEYRKDLEGKTAAIYTGGAFKVFSLVRSLKTIGMKTVIAGSQTGNQEDYRQLNELCGGEAVILDDTNPLELAKFIQEKDIDLFIGGVKERPIAYKLGVAFCDHNHERKIALAGFEGLVNFAKEVHDSVCSPVWKFVPRRNKPRSTKIRDLQRETTVMPLADESVAHEGAKKESKGCSPSLCAKCGVVTCGARM